MKNILVLIFTLSAVSAMAQIQNPRIEHTDVPFAKQTNGSNFNGVSPTQNNPTDTSINNINVLQDTPTGEPGSYLRDGKKVQYFSRNGLVISLQLSVERAYGKYYTAYISIENHSNKTVNFWPEAVKAKMFKDNIESPLPVLTYEDYMKKVRNRQNWNSALIGISAGLAASNAGSTSSQTYTYAYGYANPNSYSFGSLDHSYGTGGNVNYSTITTTHSYDATANYYAQQNAQNTVANFVNQQNEITESINLGYLKANTIFPGQKINGYMDIAYRRSDSTIVTISIDNEIYSFSWSYPAKKSKKSGTSKFRLKEKALINKIFPDKHKNDEACRY